MKDKIYMTEHHRIPRHGVDIHGTGDERNRILLPEHTHVNIHRVFGNMEFHNKVLKLIEDDKPVLQRQFVQELKKLVNERVTYIYCNGVYREYDI